MSLESISMRLNLRFLIMKEPVIYNDESVGKVKMNLFRPKEISISFGRNQTGSLLKNLGLRVMPG